MDAAWSKVFSRWQQGAPTTTDSEARPLMEALKRLSSWCPYSITLETDKVTNRCYEFGTIIRKCRELMLLFNKWQLCFSWAC